MANSSFDMSGSQGALSIPYVAPVVALFDPKSDTPFTWLPNVICEGISQSAGVAPSTARFSYIQDDTLDAVLSWPSRIDEIWPIDAKGAYVVNADDRLVVFNYNPDQSIYFMFDGFAQIPQCDLGGQSETATFVAVGVEAREFDNPITGRTQRHSNLPGLVSLNIQDTTGNSDVSVDLPCRFNPADKTRGDDGGYRPNRTPDNYDTDDGKNPIHPVFAQEGIQGRPDDRSPAYWSISDAVKYVLAEWNPKGTYTQYPALSTLDDILEVVYTQDDTAIFDAGDIQTDPLLIRDYDVTNKPWPEAVAELLGLAGFLVRWDLQAGTDGLPATYLRIYRTDMMSETPLRQVYLAEPGSDLTDTRNNACQIHLARDCNAIVNAWQVETSQRQVEVSIILTPLYEPKSGDQTPSADIATGLKQFFKSNFDKNNATAEVRRKYRWYGVDELGDGHWSRAQRSFVTGKIFDLSPVFPPGDDGSPTYVARYRPAAGHLIAEDTLKRPLEARLDIAFGVGGDTPRFATADDTKWYNVPHGWRLLPDRLGIEVTAENPDQWSTGNAGMPGGGDIRGVTWWAAAPSQIGGQDTLGFTPTLRLTCVIQDDLRMPISVKKRKASPTKFSRWRVADARDHFQYTSIDKSSANYAAQGGDGTDPVVIRDDTKAATDHARALRSAHEMPPLAGSIQMPGVVPLYEIGDRINKISGREILLYQNVGLEQGEKPTYPVVVGREYHLSPRVHTTIHLSDMRAKYATRNAY